MKKFFIVVVALILGLSGVFALFAPALTGESAGLAPSLAGLTEIRATYGGFHLGFTLFLVWCCLSSERHQYAFAAIALMMGGSALGRLAGLLIDKMPTTLQYAGLFTEIPIAVISAVLFQRNDASNTAPEN